MAFLPKWLKKLLTVICPDHLYEQIEGDLLELYAHDVNAFGKRKARFRLVMTALRFLRPGIILRNRYSNPGNQWAITRNYLKTTTRHILKSRLNFAFKLGGLTLSMFCFLIIAIYVSHQFSFDTYHVDYDKIYRVNSERKENETLEKYAVAPMSLGPMLTSQFPGVAAMTRITPSNATYFRYENKVTDGEQLIAADPSIFDVFTFTFVQGGTDALQKPNAIVLTREVASRMFGDADALHKLVSINNGKELYDVTAVIEDMPVNSSLFIDAIIPLRGGNDFTLNSILSPVEFIDNAAATYVRFHDHVPDNFLSGVDAMLDRYVDRKDRLESGFSVFIQPLSEVYRGPSYKGESNSKGSSTYLYAFSALGILLLVVACINYINLSVVDLAGRSREMGVRKVFGARQSQLSFQILTEIVIYSLVSLFISLILLYIFFPDILALIDPALRFEMILRNDVMISVCICMVVLIFFSSFFPARILTRAHVSHQLRYAGISFHSLFSRGLLFVQFSISALCICCTLMVGKQVGFIYNKELGFDRKNLLVIGVPEDFSVSSMITFKESLRQIAGVTHLSNSSFRIGSGYWKDWYFVESGKEMRSIELYEVFSDDELFSTLGVKVLKGRTFNASVPTDSGAAFVINETAARELGWEDPVGKRIYTHPEEPGKWDGTIVGVVSDINISALYEKVKPLVMRLPWQNSYPDAFVYVRYQGDGQQVVKSIEEKYSMLMPGYPLAYRFVDEFYNSRHQKEARAFTSLQFGTGVVVLVSLLGVFSLASYVSARRMKEFGIRKVLGASGKQIARLHMNYFLRIALFANGIALPLAYWMIQQWLGGFAYKIDLTLHPFLFAGVVTVILVLISGGYAAVKSATMNPIDVIKSE